LKSWLKEHNITLERNVGRKFFKTKELEDRGISQINALQSEGRSICDISRETNIPRTIINSLRKGGKINLSTKFEYWEDHYKDINCQAKSKEEYLIYKNLDLWK